MNGVVVVPMLCPGPDAIGSIAVGRRDRILCRQTGRSCRRSRNKPSSPSKMFGKERNACRNSAARGGTQIINSVQEAGVQVDMQAIYDLLATRSVVFEAQVVSLMT
jgi:hypothetical protein